MTTKTKTTWRTVRLGDLIKIKHGFAFKGEDFSAQPTKDVLITPGNFAIGGGFKGDKFKYYKGEVPSDYVLKPNDLVVTMTDLSVNADTLGYSARIPQNSNVRFLHNQRVGLVQKKNDNIDLDYLYYLMRTREYQKYVVSTASGSTVKHTSPDRIANYEHSFPSQQTQKSIAEMLSVFDKKIENNNRIIKTLEEMVQTIFKEWFVNFRFPGYEEAEFVDSKFGKIPKGWVVKALDEIADFLNGIALQKFPPKNERDVLPIVKIREMNNGVDESSESASSAIEKRYVVKTGDILFSWSGSLELMRWFGREGALNQHIFKVTSKDYPEWFFFYWIKRHLSFFRIIASGKATTMGHIQRHHLTDAQVVVPVKNVLKDADDLISPMFKKTLDLKVENQKLAAMRDLLLPRLMSREIQV